MHTASLFARTLLALAFAACGSTTPQANAPPSAPPGAPEAARSPVASPGPGAPGSEGVVVARIVDTGPIGDGRCVQRSYQIAIESVVSGDVPAGVEPIAAHFESCVDHPAPQRGPGDLEGSALDVGSTYEITLRRGTSANFGDDFMIQRARPAR